MKEYIFAYYPTNLNKVGPMEEWMAWYKENTDHVVKNVPLDSGGQELSDGGKKQIEITTGMYPMRAYDIFKAKDMDSALKLAKSCPLLKHNAGSVRVYTCKSMPKK